ncbi:MAG: pseudouridine synthase [Pseudomonadota bacterium]
MTQQPFIVPKCDKDVGILYEDEFLLVVHKPEFLLSVPGRLEENKDCVITRIQQDYPTAVVVHRLDLDTSGIMIIPLCKPAQSHIARQFQERTVNKKYTAVLFGLVEEDTFSVDLPIAFDWENRPRQKICHETGKNALTHYEVVSRDAEKNQTRVILKPVTGRSHQLRIHSANIDHPIVGCDLYAHEEAVAMSPRLLLHATEIEFAHPLTHETIHIVSPPEF